MTTKSPVLNRLKAAAAKAAARAAAAKQQVREAKAQLKAARKLFKAEKKAAKQARRKVDAAAQTVRPPKPARAPKASVLKPASKAAPKKAAPKKAAPKKVTARPAKSRAAKTSQTMRSAAEVAKSVIERLHAPPPILPPEPVIPADAPPGTGDSHGAAPRS